MASVRFVIIAAVLVGCASAKFVWKDDDDFPAFKPFKMDFPEMPKFEPIKFDPIEPINLDDLKNIKPGKTSSFSAFSSSSSSSKVVVDGKTIEDKASSVYSNVNGKVDEQRAGFHRGDKA